MTIPYNEGNNLESEQFVANGVERLAVVLQLDESTTPEDVAADRRLIQRVLQTAKNIHAASGEKRKEDLEAEFALHYYPDSDDKAHAALEVALNIANDDTYTFDGLNKIEEKLLERIPSQG